MKVLLMLFLIEIFVFGINNVVVGYDDLFEVVIGIYFDFQGMVYVVKFLGGDQFMLVVNVWVEEWLEFGQ